MKLKNIFKKYGYFMFASALIVGIGVAVGVSGGKTNNQNVVPVQNATIEFTAPMLDYNILKDYSDTELFYNATLKQWESHKAIDFVAECKDVYAVLDGTVKSVTTNYSDGTVIEITHTDGLVSRYSCLDSNVLVKQGDAVVKGQVIGQVSKSAGNECSEDCHLHFELFKNGKKVNPANYITLENK